MKILADIGGTHARFAAVNEEISNELHEIRKYKAADFTSLEAALNQYCDEHDLTFSGRLMIATAAYPDKEVWRFANKNKWVIDASALKKYGWNLDMVINDFEAATWGLSEIKDENFDVLKQGVKNEAEHTRCLLGPGTGLGLGYLVPIANNKHHVQRTHGGHMLASAQTDEQRNIINVIAALQTAADKVVFENLVSGPGLHMLYRALCQINNTQADIADPEDLLGHLDRKEVSDAYRLFHEFLGLFAHMAVVTGHAYGGLYLTGGVIEHLSEQKLFDFDAFHKYFTLPGATSVERAVNETAINIINDPYLAMHGLLIAATENQKNA